MKRFSGIYLLVVGISILGMWTMILISEEIDEGLKEFSFHLFSEFLLAFLCIISALRLLCEDGQKGLFLSMAAHGMLIYSVLNAAGYYAERGEWAFLVLFTMLFLISSFLLIRQLRVRLPG